MATTKHSKYALGNPPAPAPTAQEVVSVHTSVSLATTDIDLGDVIQMFKLPAGCIPVGYEVGRTDMDTGTPALTASLGILNAAGDAISTAAVDGGAAWITNQAWGGTADLVLHTASKAAYDIMHAVQAVGYDRTVAFVITAAAATAASGTVELGFSYKAA